MSGQCSLSISPENIRKPEDLAWKKRKFGLERVKDTYKEELHWN